MFRRGYVPLGWTLGEPIEVDLEANCVRRMVPHKDQHGERLLRESLPFRQEEQLTVLDWAAWWGCPQKVVVGMVWQ